MKKEYMKPVVEKIEFNYREQVVASSGPQVGPGIAVTGCEVHYSRLSYGDPCYDHWNWASPRAQG